MNVLRKRTTSVGSEFCTSVWVRMCVRTDEHVRVGVFVLVFHVHTTRRHFVCLLSRPLVPLVLLVQALSLPLLFYQTNSFVRCIAVGKLAVRTSCTIQCLVVFSFSPNHFAFQFETCARWRSVVAACSLFCHYLAHSKIEISKTPVRIIRVLVCPKFDQNWASMVICASLRSHRKSVTSCESFQQRSSS